MAVGLLATRKFLRRRNYAIATATLTSFEVKLF